MNQSTCIGCGCTDTCACWDEEAGQPCYWAEVDRVAGLGVCSACPDHLERWGRGDRTIAVPVEGPAHQRGYINLDGALFVLVFIGVCIGIAASVVLPWLWGLIKPLIHAATGA